MIGEQSSFWDAVPVSAQRILVLNAPAALQTLRPHDAGNRLVVAACTHPPEAQTARQSLNPVLVASPERSSLPFGQQTFDCILAESTGLTQEALTETLHACRSILDDYGTVLVHCTDHARDEFQTLVSECGLAFHCWGEEKGQETAQDLQNPTLFRLTRQEYDPLAHARALLRAGRPEWAYRVLAGIGSRFLEDPRTNAAVRTEFLKCLLLMSSALPIAQQLPICFEAQTCLYWSSYLEPYEPAAHLLQALFWQRVGRPDLASRLVRTIHHAHPTRATSAQLAQMPPCPAIENPVPDVPEITFPSPAPRILLLAPGLHDFGVDTLYDGFCRVLGEGQVVEFPYKRSLHGRLDEGELDNYPCAFNWPGEELPIEAVLAQLQEGRFDWVVFGDAERRIDPELVRTVMAASTHLPLILLDQCDSFADETPGLLEYLGRPSAVAMFKRETLHGIDYTPRTIPFPFAYRDDRIPDDIAGPRPHPLFWVGTPAFGLRRLHLERLADLLDERFDEQLPQSEYAQRLLQSRIGLSLFGRGFDTVRYWEVPAHGCLLLSARPPIQIPHNFTDGESAVFFDDLEELEHKAAHYLQRPDEATAIAQNGHDQLRRHHTGTARARDFLKWTASILQDR